MYVAAYRNTVAGSQAILAQRKRAAEIMRQEEERQARERAERIEAQNAAMREAEADLARRAEELNRELAKYHGAVIRITVARIEARICKALNVSRKDVRSDRRNREIVLARQAIMYWSARRTRLSLPQIGKFMGGLDHTTVLWGKKAYVEKRAKMGRTLREAR